MAAREMAEQQAQAFCRTFLALQEEIGKVIVGHERLIQDVLTCLFVGGHALIEGVPGLGKTLLVKTLSSCLDLEFSRIQCTPDLMPADIIGTNVVVETPEGKRFRFLKGPLFGQIVLADEINRATPKTQSALLEAMQEMSVTVGGAHYALEAPFFVLATQNPIEMEGTYPLPEAQLDRFMYKLSVTNPSLQALEEVVERTTRQLPEVKPVVDGDSVEQTKAFTWEVLLASRVKNYVARLVRATHPDDAAAPDTVKRFVRYGASPRGAQALVLGAKVNALLAGRFNVSLGDIQGVALPALRHRLILNFEGEAEGTSPDVIVQDVLAHVPTEQRTAVFGS